jgi:hypothetical protein
MSEQTKCPATKRPAGQNVRQDKHPFANIKIRITIAYLVSNFIYRNQFVLQHVDNKKQYGTLPENNSTYFLLYDAIAVCCQRIVLVHTFYYMRLQQYVSSK